MKHVRKIKQIDIAAFVGLSPQMISELRLGRRFLSKTKAKELSLALQVPFETLALSNGESLYQWLAQAYLRSHLMKNEDEA
jgi:transcriptional regulator with XRE-family HTH domain